MRVKDGFVLRKIADAYVVIPLGKEIKNFNGIITLNETAAFLFERLKNDITQNDLLSSLFNEYDVNEDLAFKDLTIFLNDLRDHGMLIEED